MKHANKIIHILDLIEEYNVYSVLQVFQRQNRIFLYLGTCELFMKEMTP